MQGKQDTYILILIKQKSLALKDVNPKSYIGLGDNKMGKYVHGRDFILPHMGLLSLLDHLIFLNGPFAPHPLGVLPHT